MLDKLHVRNWESYDDDNIRVLASKGNGDTLDVEWVDLTDQRQFSCEVSTGGNLLQVVDEIINYLRKFVNLIPSIGCQPRLDEETTMTEVLLQCNNCLQLEERNKIITQFMLKAYCIFAQEEQCHNYKFTQGEEHCNHEFAEFYLQFATLVSGGRTKRSLWYTIDTEQLSDNVDLLHHSVEVLDVNLRTVADRLRNYIKASNVLTFNYTTVFDYVSSNSQQSIMMSTLQHYELIQLQLHMNFLEYHEVLGKTLSKISSALIDIANSGQGQSVCQFYNNILGCSKDIPELTCSRKHLYVANKIETMAQQTVLKLFCVPCRAPTEQSSGLSSGNGRFLLTKTSDSRVSMLSDGQLIETNERSDSFNGRLTQLPLLFKCYFNSLGVEIITACTESVTITNSQHQTFKLRKYEMMVLNISSFPITVGAYTLTLEQIRSSIQDKAQELIINSMGISQLYNVNSLGYLLSEMEQIQDSGEISLIQVVSKYTSAKQYFYIMLVGSIVVVLTCVGWCTFKCWPKLVKCFNWIQTIGRLGAGASQQSHDENSYNARVDGRNQDGYSYELRPLTAQTDKSQQVSTRPSKSK